MCQGWSGTTGVSCTDCLTELQLDWTPLRWTGIPIALQASSNTWVSDLTYALVVEWAQIPTAIPQNLVKREAKANMYTWLWWLNAHKHLAIWIKFVDFDKWGPLLFNWYIQGKSSKYDIIFTSRQYSVTLCLNSPDTRALTLSLLSSRMDLKWPGSILNPSTCSWSCRKEPLTDPILLWYKV